MAKFWPRIYSSNSHMLIKHSRLYKICKVLCTLKAIVYRRKTLNSGTKLFYHPLKKCSRVIPFALKTASKQASIEQIAHVYFLRVFIVDWRVCKRLRIEKNSSSGNVFDVDSLKKLLVWFAVGVVITDALVVDRKLVGGLDTGNGKRTARCSFSREF